MANRVTIEVLISDNGSAKLVEGHIDKVAKSTDRLNNSQQKLEKTERNANNTREKGVIGTANSTKSFSKLAQTIGDDNSGLVGAYATLAANAFAVSAAFNTLREASQAEMVMKGLEVQSARLGTTLTNTARQVQELSRGQLSLTESMQATAQASATGFSSESIKELTSVAQNASIALGRNMGDSMDRLIKGTSKLEPELLDELGIMVKLEEATTKYALATGKNAASLSSFERRQAFLNAVLEESRLKFGGLSDQVDADPYTKLAASFSDLTKETLGLVNNTLGVSSAVEFLANNSAALISVIIMFAGTISKQLVPSLYNVSEATLAAREAINKKIEAQKRQIAITLKQAKAEKEASSAGMVSNASVEGSPKKVQEYVAALKEGTAEEGQREKAIKSLNGAIGGHTAALGRIIDKDSESYKTKQLLIESLEKQKQSLLILTTAEMNHANVVSQSQEKLDRLRQQSIALRREENAITLRGRAIEAAAEFEMGRAYSESRKSVALYNSSLVMSANNKLAAAGATGVFSGALARLTATMVPVRTGLFALSLGVRALGSALLNAIPVIGQVLFALSILWEGVKWLYNKTRPEGAEALDQALADQEERYKSTAKAAAELARVGNDSASAQVLTLTTVGNKVTEIAEGYEAIKVAQQNLGKEQEKIPTELTINLPKVQLDEQVQKLEVYKSLENLRSLGYEPLSVAIYKQIGASTILADKTSTLAQQQTVLEGILNNVKDAFTKSQDAATRLKDSFVEIDKAVQEFSKSSVASTPVDALVDSTTKASAAIYDLKAGLARGVIDARDFGIQMSGISQKAASLLPAATQDSLTKFTQNYSKLNEQLKSVDATIKEQGGTEQAATELVEKRKNLQKEITDLAAKTGGILSAAILTRQKELSELQKTLRTAQALNAADKARYDKAARNLDDSKYAARLQDQVTERQVQRSVKSLDIQIQLTKSLMHQAELKEKATKKEIELNKTQEESQKKRVAELIEADKKRTERQIIGFNKIRQFTLALYKVVFSISAVLEDTFDGIAEKMNTITKRVEEEFDKASNIVKNFLTEEVAFDKTTVSIETQEAQNKLAEIQARGFELQAVLVSTQVEVNNFQSSLEQLNASRVVELSKLLSESEKIARDLKYDTQLLNEFLGKRLEIENAIIEAASLSQNLNKNILNTFESQIKAKQRELSIELRRIDTQKEQERKTLEAQKRAKQLFLEQRGLDALTRKAAEFDLSVINARLSSLDIEKSTLKDLANYKYSIQLVESATIDIYKEGLEIQQKSLEVVQKRLSLQQQLIDQRAELENIAMNTRAAETGVEPSERAKKAAELKSAKIALDTAKAQLDIKIQGIILEYELLEAQRLATITEYKIRKQILDMYVKQQLSEAASKRAQGTAQSIKAAEAIESSMSDMNTMIGQFGTSIEQLQKYSFKDMIPLAVEVEKNAVRILEARYNQLMTEYNNIGRPTTAANIYAQAVNDISVIFRERVERALPTVGIDSVSAGKVVSKDPNAEAAKSYETSTKLLADSINTHFPDLIRNLEALDTIFSPLVGTLKKDVESATDQSKQVVGQIIGRSQDSLKETMKIAMNMATEAGAKWWQYGAQKGHTGAGHKEFRAIDVYMAPGDRESTDPKIRGRMNNLAEQYAMKGYVVLWNKFRYSLNDAGEVIKTAIEKGAHQHTTHMHVEAQKAGVIMRDSIKEGGVQAAQAMESKTPAAAIPQSSAAFSPTSSNASYSDNEIALTGGSIRNALPEVDPDSLLSRSGDLDSSIVTEVNQHLLDTLQYLESTKIKFSEVWSFATAASKPLLDTLRTLGPSGEATASAIEGVQSLGQTIISFTQSGNETFEQYKVRMEQYNAKLAETGQKQVDVADEGEFAAQRMAKGFSMAAAVIGSVMSILQSASQARIANVDKEIAAEQKRDGKSAQSIAKIEAMEKKKESIARKQFNTNKKLMLAQAVMSTAAGIASVLGDPSLPAVAKPIFAGIIGAMGLAQVAIIAGTSFEGGGKGAKSVSMPSTLSIGKRSDTVDLARGPNANAGGEAGFLRGNAGTGTNASNFRTIGSAYGGELMRGYGNRGFVVGEKGPEVLSPETPINVTPANEVQGGQPINASFNIQALDASGVQDILVSQKGNIIKMLRDAANASGQSFMEDVNVNVYTRPNVGKL